MRWEDNELIIILSVRHSRLTVDQSCHLCQGEMEKGDQYISVGIVDRLNGTKERWNLCLGCGEFFQFPSVEDAPPYAQEFLFENRMASEIWNHG